MQTLLVIDDEPSVLYSLRKSLQSESLQVLTAETAHAGVELARQCKPDVILLDVRLPDMSGLDAFVQLHALDPRTPVIFITAFTTTETAIEAMRRGAFEYLLKPFDLHHLRATVKKAIEVSRLSHVPAVLDEQSLPLGAEDRIIGETPAMQDVYKQIGRVAPQDVTVLIQGESGTGKELVARAIYHYSRRSDQPFLAINCAAIPEPLLESELFGHERGAFTGAERRRIGKFEQVHGGTLFLDEVGDMTPATQAKVLRVLQEQCFERVGSNETIRTDVRVIAATNKNLLTLTQSGRFRQDLYYRLNVFSIAVPPLRHRKDDLLLLAVHFIRQASQELQRAPAVLTPEAMQTLIAYSWPGNVRELQSTIKYALLHATGNVITVDCLPPALLAVVAHVAQDEGKPATRDDSIHSFITSLLNSGSTDIYRLVHQQLDRTLLDRVLQHVEGNQLEAAALLGISRTTLRAKLRSLGVSVEKHLMSDSDQDDQETDAEHEEL